MKKQKVVQARVPDVLDEWAKYSNVNISDKIRRLLYWERNKEQSLRDSLVLNIEYYPRPSDSPNSYRDGEFVVTAKIDGDMSEIIKGDILFNVPDYRTEHEEIVRVSPISKYSEIYPGARSKYGRLLGCRIIENKWQGIIYILDSELQQESHNEIVNKVIADIRRSITDAAIDKLEELSRAFNVNLTGETQEGNFRRYPGCTINISHPDNYMKGVWKMEVFLSGNLKENEELIGSPVPMPKLAGRLIIVDKQYAVAHKKNEEDDYELMMHFIDGVGKAHIYSNGISEHENKNSITTVADEVAKLVNSEFFGKYSL
ncbi:hypothetical protein PEC311524_33610 [Pectobacterium carotovorum subsp. carotovorum]|nr:hypothetical protein PEC311524_33610 [Pectobacterium carotovorum subsp. carotovorum]